MRCGMIANERTIIHQNKNWVDSTGWYEALRKTYINTKRNYRSKSTRSATKVVQSQYKLIHVVNKPCSPKIVF